MKRLLIGVSAAAMLAGAPVLAQTTTPPGAAPAEKTAPPLNQGNADKGDMKPGQNMKPGGDMTRSGNKGADGTKMGDANKDGDKSDKRAAGNTPPDHSALMDVRASKLIGSTVYTANGEESIGDINDLILDGEGKVAQVIVGVGGFLGIGERNVAVSLNDLKIMKDNNNNIKIAGDFTKESLKSMPAWEEKRNRSVPSGTGSGVGDDRNETKK